MARVYSTQEIRDFWNEYASMYELFYVRTTVLANKLLLPLLRIKENDTVVETGCGTGIGVELILQECPSVRKILANDISEHMIEKAQAKNLPKTEYSLASNECLPYESTSCDSYISNLSLQIVERPEDMVKESYRILKPNGRAAFSVWGKKSPTNFFQMLRRVLEKIGCEPNHDRDYFHLGDQQKLNKLLTDSGFVNVKSFYTSLPILANNVEEFLDISSSGPEIQEMNIKNLETDLFEKAQNELREEYKKMMDIGSFFTFDLLIVYGQKN